MTEKVKLSGSIVRPASAWRAEERGQLPQGRDPPHLTLLCSLSLLTSTSTSSLASLTYFLFTFSSRTHVVPSTACPLQGRQP